MSAPPRPSDVTTSGIQSWLAEHDVALAMATGAARKLLVLGAEEDGRLSLGEGALDGPRALAVEGRALWVAGESRVHRFGYGPAPGQLAGDGPEIWAPRAVHTTGALGIADVALDGAGRPVLVASRFDCLATLDDRHSFRPVWRPRSVPKLAPDDRCHLSGVAMRDGAPAFVTAFGTGEVAGGWRSRLADGGCVLDAATGEPVATGLAMPVAPRWHDGRLWIGCAGTGEIGWIDLARGAFEPVAFCPGVVGALALAGDHAVVGLSSPSQSGPWGGLPLARTLHAKGTAGRAGVHVVDLRTGAAVHWVRLEGAYREVPAVALLPGARRPLLLTLG